MAKKAWPGSSLLRGDAQGLSYRQRRWTAAKEADVAIWRVRLWRIVMHEVMRPADVQDEAASN